jgi:hypothetical protein
VVKAHAVMCAPTVYAAAQGGQLKVGFLGREAGQALAAVQAGGRRGQAGFPAASVVCVYLCVSVCKSVLLFRRRHARVFESRRTALCTAARLPWMQQHGHGEGLGKGQRRWVPDWNPSQQEGQGHPSDTHWQAVGGGRQVQRQALGIPAACVACSSVVCRRDTTSCCVLCVLCAQHAGHDHVLHVRSRSEHRPLEFAEAQVITKPYCTRSCVRSPAPEAAPPCM